MVRYSERLNKTIAGSGLDRLPMKPKASAVLSKFHYITTSGSLGDGTAGFCNRIFNCSARSPKMKLSGACKGRCELNNPHPLHEIDKSNDQPPSPPAIGM